MVPNHLLGSHTPSLKGKTEEGEKASLDPKGQSKKNQDEQDEPDDRADQQEGEPEVYLVDAQTYESEVESDGMLDWAASECKDYKDGAFATVCTRVSSSLSGNFG